MAVRNTKVRYLVVIDGVRVRHGRVTAAGKRRRRRLCRVRPGDEVCDVDRPSTLRRSRRAAAAGLSEDGRHLSCPHGPRRGDTQGPRGRVSGVQRGAGRERSWASRAMGDPSPDSDIFEGRVGKGEGSPRVRACAEKERRDRWDGMRFNPGPAADAPAAIFGPPATGARRKPWPPVCLWPVSPPLWPHGAGEQCPGLFIGLRTRRRPCRAGSARCTLLEKSPLYDTRCGFPAGRCDALARPGLRRPRIKARG